MLAKENVELARVRGFQGLRQVAGHVFGMCKEALGLTTRTKRVKEGEKPVSAVGDSKAGQSLSKVAGRIYTQLK